jgi:pyridoxal phosphate enzyme (YggS family)
VPTSDEVVVAADHVRERIAAAGGDPERVRLLAVTKGFPADVARTALAAGLLDLGVNFAQDLEAKAVLLGSSTGAHAADEPPAPRWHFIGRLQRNKVKLLAPHVALWQSIDRLELGREVARRAPGASVLVQVNPLAEPQKGGCPPDEVADLVHALRDEGLDVQGLMAVGPTPGEGPRSGTADEAFTAVARLADALGLHERSMGMSDDLEAAVAAGSTMVRVGRGLFGDRPAR